MAALNTSVADRSDSIDDRLSASAPSQRSNALANKLSQVLSASYADSEVRDALQTLDDRKLKNTAETRRRLRWDVQKEVIDRNGDIIQDFGRVAEVCPVQCFQTPAEQSISN